MDLETISLISEPVSAFALLLTLYFLFKQIKLQTKALEKSNNHTKSQLGIAINNALVENFDLLMKDEKLHEIVDRGIENKPLDKREKRLFFIYINRWLALLESVILVSKSEVLFLDDYDLKFLLRYCYPARLVQTQAGKEWLDSDATIIYSREFIESLKSGVSS